MTLDILFVAKNRLEFTREALAALKANTNWNLVRYVICCDDASTDGTRDLLYEECRFHEVQGEFLSSILPVALRFTSFGSPAAAMNEFFQNPNRNRPDVVCKLDNDVIVPPGWLDACFSVMEAHPELDLLGIEPPASRVPHFEGGKRSPTPEYHAACTMNPDGELGYAPCDSIGGIGLMRTKAFLDNAPLKPHSTYGGFTEWQLEHPKIRKGWIVPPLDVFLLDRLPFAPWSELSKVYESKGWQRPWSKYPKDCSSLWKWWVPAGEGLGVAAAYGAPPSAPCATTSATERESF